MAISLPGTYDNTDLGSASGVATGMDVTASTLAVVAKNNNFMYGRYVGPVCQAVFGDGPRGPSTYAYNAVTETWAQTKVQGTYEDLVAFPLPADRSQRGYQVHIWAEHTGDGATSDGHIKLRIAGSDVHTFTVTKTSSAAQHSATFDNPTASDADLVVQCDNYYIRIWAVSVTRQRFDNTTITDDSPIPGPFYWMQTGRLVTSQPLTDEWVNRGLDNPAKIVATQLHSLACVNMPIKNGTTIQPASGTTAAEYEADTQYPWGLTGIDADSNQAPVFAVPFVVRYAQTVTVYSHLRGPAGTTLRIIFTPNVKATGFAKNATTLPSAGSTYSWTKTTVELTAGAYFCMGYFDKSIATTDKARLYSLSIVGGEPLANVTQ